MRASPKLCLLAAILFAACGGGNPAQPGPPAASPIAFASHASAHFLQTVLGIDEPTFVSRWFEYERQRHGL